MYRATLNRKIGFHNVFSGHVRRRWRGANLHHELDEVVTRSPDRYQVRIYANAIEGQRVVRPLIACVSGMADL
jgi:hypothetical protein